MFRWDPEGRFCHRLCTAIAPFWFSMEYLWTSLMPFWLSTDDISWSWPQPVKALNCRSRSRLNSCPWGLVLNNWNQHLYVGLRSRVAGLGCMPTPRPYIKQLEPMWAQGLGCACRSRLHNWWMLPCQLVRFSLYKPEIFFSGDFNSIIPPLGFSRLNVDLS